MATLGFKTMHGSGAGALIIAWGILLWAGSATAASPSFECGKAKSGSSEEMICKDEGLAALDRKLADVYAAASKKAVNEHPPVLKAEQRGWIKGRDDCWKSSDRRACVEENYRLRIAELQAKYRLVPGTGPIFYTCDGDPKNEVIAIFFPDRTSDADRRARRRGIADVSSAECQWRQIPGTQRVPLGAPR
jgi:uncharacterized protein